MTTLFFLLRSFPSTRNSCLQSLYISAIGLLKGSQSCREIPKQNDNAEKENHCTLRKMVNKS